MKSEEKQIRVSIKRMHSFYKEWYWEKSLASKLLRSIFYFLGFSQCRYCIYFEPKEGKHQSIRESPFLLQGSCKWSNLPGAVLGASDFSAFKTCQAFLPVLYNVKGYDFPEDKVHKIFSRRRYVFFKHLQLWLR
ncbi:hypothetical protein [Candidatus Velamenicoccus archaeovorus]|uniref:hypothetical protein n=1 Tax=Velamenicoccus archaeovorus TaxID=1930593 RepID=UPI000FFE50B7|nr:hypothetical protein [Candidatus Velamenicoccus archaeovorus]